jgi:hypothetical protein
VTHRITLISSFGFILVCCHQSVHTTHESISTVPRSQLSTVMSLTPTSLTLPVYAYSVRPDPEAPGGRRASVSSLDSVSTVSTVSTDASCSEMSFHDDGTSSGKSENSVQVDGGNASLKTAATTLLIPDSLSAGSCLSSHEEGVEATFNVSERRSSDGVAR